MALWNRLALWLAAVAVAAAPTLALAAQLCSGCCCPPTPCHDMPAPCDAAVATVPCCDAAPPALPSALKRASDAPACAASTPERWRPALDVGSSLPWQLAADPGARSSPLRLSVVLRI